MPASPSMIVQAYLVQQGIAQLSAAVNPSFVPGLAVCYVGSMPDDDDLAIFIFGPSGRVFGRCQNTGQVWIHKGLRFIIRGPDYPTGWSLAQQVIETLDNPQIAQSTIAVDGQSYYISSVYRTSDVAEMGEETDKRRNLFVFYARMAFQDGQQPPVG